uniref:acyltransferase n=1 Tax=Algoriphagus sp. TaxID=1872435 RepID=UPI00258D5C84|nr:acyltransferase [Algoriphagus sp.]
MNREEKLSPSPEQLEFFKKLQSLKEEFDRIFKSDFNRSLPFADLVFDRWERAKSLGFGEGSSIYDSSYVFGNVSVGEKTWVGPFTVLDGSGGLAIGTNCSISAGVQIYSHDTVEWAVSRGTAPYAYAPVQIGNNCYLGPNVIVSSGVTLGDGCIVGANSFVNKSFPAGSKIAGSPAKLIGPTSI